MICEDCNNHEAICAIKVIKGNESTTKYVCGECMLKYNQAIQSGNIHQLLANILSAFSPDTSADKAPEEDIPDIVCENCGMTYRQFKESGRLGCPECYTAFRSELEPMLSQIHGRTQHAGRQLLKSEQALHIRSQQEELTRLMNQAVAVEDFETAALLRDQIRQLTQEATGA